jgi:hypothetical protein
MDGLEWIDLTHKHDMLKVGLKAAIDSARNNPMKNPDFDQLENDMNTTIDGA